LPCLVPGPRGAMQPGERVQAKWDPPVQRALAQAAPLPAGAGGPPRLGRAVPEPTCWRQAAAPVSAPRGLRGLFEAEVGGAYEPLDIASLTPDTVLLNVYDVGGAEIFQKINRVSTVNDNVLIGGIFHAGVEVYGSEWAYGFAEDEDSGVFSIPPRCGAQHTYRATVTMGPTALSRSEVDAVLLRLRACWRGPEYSLIGHNCLDFANAFAQELGVGRIPGWIDRFGRTASSIDGFRKGAAAGVHHTKQLARSVSMDVEQTLRGVGGEMEQVVAGARRQVPKIGEAAQVSAQALGAGVARWGRGLFTAAARALGDDQASRERRGGALRASLRNRGGVSMATRNDGRRDNCSPGGNGAGGAPRRPVAAAPVRSECEVEDDPFLLSSAHAPLAAALSDSGESEVRASLEREKELEAPAPAPAADAVVAPAAPVAGTEAEPGLGRAEEEDMIEVQIGTDAPSGAEDADWTLVE